MPDDPVIDVVDAAPRRGRKPRAQPATGPLDAVEETLDDASADLPEPAVVAPQGRTNMPTAIPEFVLAEPVPVPALTPVTDTLEVLSPLIFAGHRVTRIAWMNADRWVAMVRCHGSWAVAMAAGERDDITAIAAKLPTADDLMADDWYVVG